MSELPPEDQDAFTSQERLALDAWHAPEPRADLAAAVLARMGSEPVARAPRRAGRLAFRIVLVVAAVGLAWRSFVAPAQAVSGALVADRRTTVPLAARGVAVAEAGAELRWQVEGDGAAAISQVAGDVFYRVEPGARFAVSTPAGDVTVTGTCFRVQVEAGKEGEMRAGTKMAGSALAGAVATAVVLVTVYEGRVAVASEGRTAAVEPGQRATLTAGRAPTVEDARPSAPAAAVAVNTPVEPAPAPAAPTVAVPAAPTPAARCDPAAADELAREKAANTALSGEVAALEVELKKAQRVADKYRTFDLTPETLKGMAERCELRWDHPAIRVGEKPTVDDEAVASLKLTKEEQDAVAEELTKFNTDTLAELRRIYTEVTGDDQVGSLASEAMFAELNDKSDRTEIRLTFEKLAAERAGLAQPPEEGAEMPSVERAYRLMTAAGDRLEAAMAARIGTERARELREYRNGWGSASRSTYGCPKRTP